MMVGYNSVNMFYFPYSKKKIFYNPLLNVASYGQICLGDNPDLSTSNDPKVIEHNLNHILNLIYNSSWTVEPDMDSYEVYLKHTPDTDYWDRVGNHERKYEKFLNKWVKKGKCRLIRNKCVEDYYAEQFKRFKII